MSLATEQEFRDMLGGIEAISSATIERALADARTEIGEVGVSEDYSGFARLQRYFAAHLLTVKGDLGQIASEAVADVSINYGTSSNLGGTQYANDWDRLYRQGLARAQGMLHRVFA